MFQDRYEMIRHHVMIQTRLQLLVATVTNELLAENVPIMNVVVSLNDPFLAHVIQSRRHIPMRLTYLPWFVLNGPKWAEGLNGVTPGPCLAWLEAPCADMQAPAFVSCCPVRKANVQDLNVNPTC